MRGGPSLMAIALAACGARERLDLQIAPLIEGTESALVVFSAGGESEVFAIDPKAVTPDRLPYFDDAPDALEVVVLAYDFALGDLDIVGPGRVATTTAEPRFPLPGVGRFHQASVVGGVASSFAPIAALPAQVAGLHLPGSLNPCPEWTPRRVSIPSGELQSAAAFGDSSVVLAPDEGPLYVVSPPSYVAEALPVPADAPREVAHRDALGRVWLMTGEGRVAELVEATRTIEERAPFPTLGEIGFVDDGAPDAGGRVWVLGMRGHFRALEGGAWVMDGVHEDETDDFFDAEGSFRDWARGIAEIDGTVITTRRAEAVAKIYAPGAPRREIETPEGAGFSAAITSRSQGAVFASVTGALYRLELPDRWIPLPGDLGVTHGLPIYAMAESGGFIHVGSPGGFVATFVPGFGYCPATQVVANAVERIIPRGEDLVVVGENERFAVWLEAR